MRVLLDENLPLDLARDLLGHDVQTVVGLGWEGVKNGELLRRAAGHFDVLVTMDRNLEFQQSLARQPFGVVLATAASNRMLHLRPIVPAILAALHSLRPGELRRVSA
jgi:predicted nuclease of predicted toxin-antitoxin system